MQNTCLTDAILRWMNAITFLRKHSSFIELVDGTLFIQMLNHINGDQFGNTFKVLFNQQVTDNWAVNMSRLKLILDKLNDYTHTVNDINVMLIAKDSDVDELLKFLGTICQLILQSDFQDDFITPVLQLSDEDQELISQYLQSLVIPVEKVTEDGTHLLEKIDELELENQKLVGQIQSKDRQLKDMGRIIKHLEEDQIVRNELIEQLEQQQVRKQFVDLNQDSLREANTKIWQLQQKIIESQQLINELQSQLKDRDSLQQENQQLKFRCQQLTTLESKIEHLKDKLSQEKTNHKNTIEEKDKQLQNLQQSFQEVYGQYQQEKGMNLNLELEIQKLNQKVQEANYANLEKEQNYMDKIRQMSRRNSIDRIEQNHRSSSNMDYLVLATEIQPQSQQQQDFLSIHQQTLTQAEENHKKEIEVLNEKNKTLEQQVKAWKQINQRLETKTKELEGKVKNQFDQYSTNQLNKQNEQIQMLSSMIIQFNEKYKQLKGEHQRILKLN